MAEIVLGMGTSHTPMLFTPPEDWPKYEVRDRSMELLDKEGRARPYDELVAEAGAHVREALRPANLSRAYANCQKDLDRLAEILVETAPDVLIVIGDDQKELFQVENLPAILVYWGESIPNKYRKAKSGEPAWWSNALQMYYGRERDETFPVASDLSLHIIRSLINEGFDPAQSTALPEGRGEGHAFAFIHSRLLRYRQVPIVPVFLNTYYPPNQPTPKRCYLLGSAIRSAVESWDREARVAVVASGGLTHFVIDEDLDRALLTALSEGDTDALTRLPVEKLNSGTSEVRNWIAMYGASEHLSHQWTDYVPAYRTPAGTGTGCAFGYWK